MVLYLNILLISDYCISTEIVLKISTPHFVDGPRGVAKPKHVNNSQEPRNIATLLQYEPIYHHTIPHRAEQLSQVSLPHSVFRS